MHAELREGLKAASADPDCRVVVLTGAGRAFSAGQDLAEMGGCHRARARRRQAAGEGLQSADQDDHHAGEAGDLRGQRHCRRCGRQRRARMRPGLCRPQRQFLQAFAGSASSRRRRHLGAAAAGWRRPRARPCHAGRAAAGREGRGLGPDLEMRRRRQAGGRGRSGCRQARRRPDLCAGARQARACRLLDQHARPAARPRARPAALAGASPDAREGIAAFLEKRAPKYTGRKA